MARRALVLLVALLAALAALVGSGAPVAQAQALSGCGLKVTAPSKAHVNVSYTFKITWPGFGLGLNGTQDSATWQVSGIAPQPIGVSGGAFVVKLRSRGSGKVTITFHVHADTDTAHGSGSCDETFTRTVKISS